ncbi:MAG: hypothetical protein J6Y88_06545 [Bacteroidales bacterium]|nr:hypothetical protein [Bacteroidales bacterium]
MKDVDIFAACLKELLLENDTVTVPGLGSFITRLMPASFSDRGRTINPPYRKLSFRASEQGDGQLFTNRLSEHDIFFYNNSGNPEGVNRELDFILTGPGQEHAFLFECKFTQNDSPHRNSTLLSGHLEKNELRAADIDGRYVIYNGKPSVQYWDQIKGNVIFTPVGEMLDNYFEFEKNVETIKGKRNDDRDDNNGNNGGLPEQISEKIAEIAEKAKKVVSETAEIIAEHKRKITESFAFADMRQTRPVFER